MIKYAKQDIRSHVRPDVLYAPQGADVFVYRDYGSVYVVVYKGRLFPCSPEKLSDEPVAPKPPEQPIKKKR